MEEIKMETKSRYEVINELENKKRSLILERDSFEMQIKEKDREIKNMKRGLEDMEEDLVDFKASIEERKATIAELIASVDESLKRLSSISQSQKK